MKKVILFLFASAVAFANVYAQCSYEDYSDAPKELFRKRVKDNIDDFRYGNPYTMFNRSDYNSWNLTDALYKVQQNFLTHFFYDKAV